MCGPAGGPAVPTSGSEHRVPHLFRPGTTMAVRDVIHGRPFAVWPHRVISDDGHELVVVLRSGTRGVAPALWARALRDDDPRARAEILPCYARQRWDTESWTWRDTTRLSLLYPDRHFAVSLLWDLAGELRYWYVNFQVPYHRTAVGVDTSDLHIDLVVDPDLRYRWKDEDEYAQARRLGLVTDACHRNIQAAREEAVALIEERRPPFADPWPGWRPDPAWPLPLLPDQALTEPTAPQLAGLPH